MILYGDRGSSNTRRVLTVAMHVGIDFKFNFINIFESDNRRDDYLLLNPNGTIPTLVDGNIVLFEASAIMIYFAEKTNSYLWPRDESRYQVLKWMFWAAEHFRRGSAVLIEEQFLSRLRGQKEDIRLVSEATTVINRYAGVLDQYLSSRPFVAGSTPTLADIDLAAPFSHILRTNAPYGKFSNLMEWHRRLGEAIPEWQETGRLLEHRIVEIETMFGKHMSSEPSGQD